MDLDGLRMGDALDSDVQDLLKKIIRTDSDNYPELSGKMFIVNAPFMFKAVWNVLQSFMDARTREKITMCGSNYRSTLLEFVNEEDLPDFLGGSCSCPGGCCHSRVGPWRDFPLSPRRLGVPPLGEETEDVNEDSTVESSSLPPPPPLSLSAIDSD